MDTRTAAVAVAGTVPLASSPEFVEFSKLEDDGVRIRIKPPSNTEIIKWK